MQNKFVDTVDTIKKAIREKLRDKEFKENDAVCRAIQKPGDYPTTVPTVKLVTLRGIIAIQLLITISKTHIS